ncbi:BCCT family transporter [Cobetia sp. cqz5-12]|uniref:BCCT family transporter n=1 Tax=Cobetia TaxID=204286 RepID=UPI00174813A7|nr:MULTISPECIES: BCCT family transporter [Cobetia]QQK64565.1 BCCT family transporter [Cobetia sp. cqz5-12]UBU47497.1 BCCT family transporter [Cobetia amphilecti]
MQEAVPPASDGDHLDPRVFIPAVLVILAFIGPVILFPEASTALINAAFSFATGKFGWLYLVAGLSVVGFLIWLAFSRYGNVRLGGAEDTPDFSYFSWVAMIFTCGMGIAIVNWAWVEPIYYYTSPAYHVAAKSREAAEWALAFGQFHWGLTPWAFYCLPGLPIAYSMYVKKRDGVRLSVASRGVLGRHADGAWGVLLDSIVVFGIVGGVGTSLGLAVPLVSQLVSGILGMEANFGLEVAVLCIWTAMFSASVWFGLAKGIKILSDVNVILAIFLLAFTFIVGDSQFMVEGFVNSLGKTLGNFIPMSLWTDPAGDSTFWKDWTVFYWAWWIAYAPMVGLFVARISRGRTIRELIIAELVFGSLGTWVFFAVWGGYALDLQISGALDIKALLDSGGIPLAVEGILQTLPYAKLVTVAFILLCFIFLATTLDSSAYVLASVTSRKLSGYQEPKRSFRLIWAFLIAAVGVALIQLGGLQTVQTSTIVVALPMIPVMLILALSMLRWLKNDFPKEELNPVLVIDDMPAFQRKPKKTNRQA